MGLLNLAASLLGGGQNNNSGASSLISTVLQVLNNQPGGITGVVQSLQQGGLSEAVSSWVGAGQNMPVSADALQGILGSGAVQELASKLGVDPSTAGSHLSELLPGIVDHLTPNGAMPQNGLEGAGMDLVKGLLSKSFGF